MTTLIGGYDSHRGWVNYLAVHHQRNGTATALIQQIREMFGCPLVLHATSSYTQRKDCPEELL